MKNLSGKAAEPTAEELEFIYSRIRLLSDSEIIEEMQEETSFPVRTTGSIKRRRKEFHAAEKVIEHSSRKEVDPATARIKIKHWAELSESAEKIRNNIQTLESHKNCLLVGNILSGHLVMLSVGGKETERRQVLTKIDKVIADSLLQHLKNEFDEFKSLRSWDSLKKTNLNNFSPQMKRILEIVAHRRWFAGTCGICTPWQ